MSKDTSLELQKYATLDGTEVGEACELLVALTNYPDYLSDEFLIALQTEIKEQLTDFTKYRIIVKTEETITRTVTGLEWK